MRALASLECGAGSIPADSGSYAIWVCWLFTLHREVFLRVLWLYTLSSEANNWFDFIWIQVICVNFKFQLIVSPISAPALERWDTSLKVPFLSFLQDRFLFRFQFPTWQTSNRVITNMNWKQISLREFHREKVVAPKSITHYWCFAHDYWLVWLWWLEDKVSIITWMPSNK